MNFQLQLQLHLHPSFIIIFHPQRHHQDHQNLVFSGYPLSGRYAELHSPPARVTTAVCLPAKRRIHALGSNQGTAGRAGWLETLKLLWQGTRDHARRRCEKEGFVPHVDIPIFVFLSIFAERATATTIFHCSATGTGILGRSEILLGCALPPSHLTSQGRLCDPGTASRSRRRKTRIR